MGPGVGGMEILRAGFVDATQGGCDAEIQGQGPFLASDALKLGGGFG